MDSGRLVTAARAVLRLLVPAVLVVFGVLLPAASAAAQDGESVRGTLNGPDGDPVADATIEVTQSGNQIGEDTTGQDGSWEVELPGPGDYDVTLRLDSLPSEMVPRERGGEVLEGVSVKPGQSRAVLFPLVSPDEQRAPGGGGSGGQGDGGEAPPSAGPSQPPFGERLADVLVNGIQYGAVIAISAVGLSLVFGTTRLINFAHGELVTIGAVVAYFVNAAALGPGWALIPAGLIAVAFGAAFGGAVERGLWRPLRRRGTGRINMFIISIGLSLLLRHVILVFYGSRPGSYTDYDIQSGIELGPVTVTPRDLTIVALSVLTLLGFAFMLQRTRIGTAIRAVSDNRDLAESSGIDVQRVVLVVWVLGGGLAAFGGVLFGLNTNVQWDMGFKLLLLMFAGVILGGLGSAYGAMIGSFVVGIVAHVSTLWFPNELQNAWALLVLIVVLLVRPQGILGRKERIG